MASKKNKKKIQRNFNIVLVLFAFIFISVVIQQVTQIQTHDKTGTPVQPTVNSDVEKYTPILRQELEKVDLEEYTVVLAAIMEQESRGKGGDPMQSSESAGLAPNSINDPHQSIKQGVKHFQNTLAYGNKRQVDFQTIIQAYNMGLGYIDFVAEKGGTHSETIAKEFSAIQVDKNPKLYNCGGDQNNFRYPYCYGDFTYTTKVTKNINTLIASNPDLPSFSLGL
ncbi:Lysozyme-like [Mesobacillus persicus]|uniref:Lysozyme-like n=1 Tax=Mesobacillus persicus TaxID=930146 RepID=A0A1H7WE93_9BACI|nr:lysozyme family protein [Mesobacillus persicus]SEM19791.1 Lysozyme-like [Mesobacillus persicus]